ncbi:MAG: hypothetical protein H7Y32_00260, partial [Chloroflexales bacterium]|nr:hypothetical protein [Chloroflexales bacterium]
AFRNLPFAAVDAYVHKRRQQGWNAGAIKQGLEREQGQLCGHTVVGAQRVLASPDWHGQARMVCPADTAPDDVQWVATLLSEGSPPAEAQALLVRRIARRANTAGGSYVAA